MQNIQIWHNQSCSKSRNAMTLLEDKKIKADVRNYLENPPSKEELKEEIIKLLNNEQLRNSIANEGYVFAQNFSDENIAKNIMNVYLNI